MTEKEKAIELVQKFLKLQVPSSLEFSIDSAIKRATKSALVAVDEVLKIVYIYNDTQSEYSYWLKIKEELENGLSY
jgi:hypothetical protein